MNMTIYKVLHALNEIEVKGEKNHNMLLYAIQQLKPLQNMPMIPEPADKAPGVNSDGNGN
ncbi:MAG: hypothetical protein ACI4WX_12295 [Aristaeellaceae bacterium]